jgi:hypothetical protein
MKTLALALVLLCSVVAARGGPPSDESILKMMNSFQLQAALDQTVTQLDAGMKKGLKQLTEGKELSPLQTAELGQLQTRMSATIRDELAFAKMKDIYLQVYRELFTQEEVNGINAFVATPAGKAMIEKLPQASSKVAPLLQARMAPVAQKVRAMQLEFMKEQSGGK